MKAIVIERFGPAAEMARCVERDDPPAPGPGEVRLRVLVATINPADLLLIEGRYGQLPKLPAIPGAECAARVEAVGEGVTSPAVGDLVVPMATSNWREIVVTKAAAVVKLPPGTDPAQAAMLKANPATALAMLEDVVALQPGDWVIQNAANSAVGRYVAKLARHKGIRTIGIVRRTSLVDELVREGADAVLVDDGCEPEEMAKRVAAVVGAGRVALGFDAVGGVATQALGSGLSEGATLVNYGLLSGEACRVHPNDLVFRDVRVQGFWLAKWFRTAAPERIARLYATLAALVADGTLRVPVAATYSFARIAEALAHAAREGRDGKIQLAPG